MRQQRRFVELPNARDSRRLRHCTHRRRIARMAIETQPKPCIPRHAGTHGDDGVIRTVALTKTFQGRGGEVHAVAGLDLVGAQGRDLRAARTERRGQDHDGRHAHDPRDPHVGRSVGRRHRRGRATGRRQAGDRRRVADQHARPFARRRREPLLPRSLLRHERPGSTPQDRRAARDSSGSPTAPGPTSPRCRAAWPSG